MKPESSYPIHRSIPRLLTWILNIFFRLLYNQFALTYDCVAWVVSLGQWKKWISTVIPYLHESPILELGHGPGHLQIALKQSGKHCFGLDLSRYMSQQAYRRLRCHHLPAHLIRARSQQLPFSSNSLPQIVSTFPSEYIADPESLSEIYRVLVPGGSAVILLAAWITGRSILDRLASWLFHVTGQSPVWRDYYLCPAREAGFNVRSEFQPLPKSTLLLIHLTKPEVSI